MYPDPTTTAADLVHAVPTRPPATAGRYELVRTVQGFVVLDHTTGLYAAVTDTGAAASTPAAPSGLAPMERRLIVITASGATLLLAGGGAVLMAGHGIAAARPALHDLSQVLEWAAFLVAALVVGLAVILGRRVVRGGTTSVREAHHYHTESHGLFSRATTNVRE